MENEHGLDQSRPAQDNVSIVVDSSDSGGKAQHTALVIPAAAITISAAILSIGGVAGLMYFIHSCFVHPDVANILIPLLLTSCLPDLLRHLRDRKEKKSE